MKKCQVQGCDKQYSNTKVLQHHMREVHSSDATRICRNCGILYASITSRKRHENECFKEIQLNSQKQPITEKNNNNNRHVHVSVQLSPNCTSILTKFSEWLENGGYSPILKNCKRKLTSKSVSTYTLHLRSFMNFINETKREKDDIIKVACNTSSYKSFLEYLEKSGYCCKTIANKIFALERMVGFLYEEMDVLNNENLTTLTKTTIVKKKLFEVMEFLLNESSLISPAANRETIVRNSRQSLEAEGKWEDLPTILLKFNGKFYLIYKR